MKLLSVQAVSCRHGLLRAVRDVSLDLDAGEVLALVGANGAGKTTLLRAIAGAHPVDGGQVILDGTDVTHISAHRRVGLGIALVPEGRRLFPELTVEENLIVAAAAKRAGAWSLDTVLDAFPMLQPLRSRRATLLSGGEQQAVAIGRALMSNPRVLLLDEVSLGLSPAAVETIYASLRRLTKDGTGLVLVEQDLGRAMEFGSQLLCMLHGSIVLRGRPSDLDRDRVTAAYFGLRQRASAGVSP